MAFLFNKFQEAVKILAKSPTFAKDPRKFQFEADINRLFLYTSHNRLGSGADEKDAEEIIEMASNASVDDQQKQVQDNVHCQVETFCKCMDEILIPALKNLVESQSPSEMSNPPRRSGLSLAVGRTTLNNSNAVPETKDLKRADVSQRLKELIGYTLEVKPSQIPHEKAGQGLFLNGEADLGAVIAFYPGVVYSPAYYRYIPGYPRVDAQNSYLITRYDGAVINAKPWGVGGESREIWDGSCGAYQANPIKQGSDSGSDRMWKMLSKPLEGTGVGQKGEVMELRNPLALGHFANHPAKEMAPNVMVCPYDFPLTEKGLRPYIPNISFGDDDVNMKKLGSFWFKSWKSSGGGAPGVAILKSLVLVATRPICDEEVLLNYRLSNSKRRPSWYTPVDEEEDQRRWS